MSGIDLHRPGLALAMALACGCSSSAEKEDQHERIRLWHTFNPAETEALNRALDRRPSDLPVEPTLLPFARAHTIIGNVLRSGKDCPDLIRIDATWLPGLARAGLLRPVPAALRARRDWLPEAIELARDNSELFGLPHTLDGLALIRRRGSTPGFPWPPVSVDALVAAARDHSGTDRHGLGVRIDGYWFVAFARAWGGELIDPGAGVFAVEGPAAERALERFATLFGDRGVSPPPSPSGSEADAEALRFRSGKLAVVMTGPWAVTDLGGGNPAGLEVAAFPGGVAPRGGQVLVVPVCARRASGAWKLALELTAPALQSAWARKLGVVPTTRRGLAGAGPVATEFYQALEKARPLPRHPMTPELFDDLNPAIAAVVAGDASAREALAGVARAWKRLARRHEVQLRHTEPRRQESQP